MLFNIILIYARSVFKPFAYKFFDINLFNSAIIIATKYNNQDKIIPKRYLSLTHRSLCHLGSKL